MTDTNKKTSECVSGSATLPVDESADQLARLAWALAHPARVRILRLLLSRKACVCGEIVSELPLAQSTVSQHLKILKEAGLIQGEVDGPRVCYCIDSHALDTFHSLVDSLQPITTGKNPDPEDCCA